MCKNYFWSTEIQLKILTILQRLFWLKIFQKTTMSYATVNKAQRKLRDNMKTIANNFISFLMTLPNIEK